MQAPRGSVAEMLAPVMAPPVEASTMETTRSNEAATARSATPQATRAPTAEVCSRVRNTTGAGRCTSAQTAPALGVGFGVWGSGFSVWG